MLYYICRTRCNDDDNEDNDDDNDSVDDDDNGGNNTKQHSTVVPKSGIVRETLSVFDVTFLLTAYQKNTMLTTSAVKLPKINPWSN